MIGSGRELTTDLLAAQRTDEAGGSRPDLACLQCGSARQSDQWRKWRTPVNTIATPRS